MIKINDRFAIKRTPECWILYDKHPTDHPKSKTGYTTSQTYYSRLGQVIDEIFERTPEGCKDLKDMYNRMQLIKGDVFRAIMGGNIEL